MTDIAEQDNWITHLGECKQLTEADVKRLCDKVRNAAHDSAARVRESERLPTTLG